MSIWIAGVPIFGTAQKCVVMPPVSRADEADEIGAIDGAVGAFARIAADHADRQRMVPGMKSLPLSEVATGICSASASATSSRPAPEARAPPPATMIGRSAFCSSSSAAFTCAASGSGRNGGTRAKLRLDQRLHLGFLEVDLALVAAELQVHGTRRAGGGDAERLPHHVGNARDLVDGGVELGHRLECRHVVDFLIDLAELGLRIAPAGHGDHRRMRKISVAQAGGEIERADHLRHADAGLAGRARVAVGHVGGGFLAVAMHARDLGAPLHLGEGAPQHRRHHEDVRDAIARQHVGEHFGADAFGVVSDRCHAVQAGLNFSATPLMQ